MAEIVLPIEKVEYRTLPTNLGRFLFTNFVLSINYSELQSGFMVVPRANMRGSLLQSSTTLGDESGTTAVNSIGDTITIHSVLPTGTLTRTITHTNDNAWSLLDGNNSIAGLTSTRGSGMFIFSISTKDDYTCFIMDSFRAIWYPNTLTYSLCSTGKYGYFEYLPSASSQDYYRTTSDFTQRNHNIINYSKIYSSDPYDEGGTSTAHGGVGGGGGTGDFDNSSDTIGLPSLPSLSGLNTGFFTAFIPSASQMQSVSNYLWNNFLDDLVDPQQTIGEKVDALKKIVANPYDAIMGCSVIPVTPPTAGSKELKMYGIIETGISMPYASTRWVTVDCGTLNIHEFWGGYLDYSPYTKTTSLYLPYIGTVSIDIDLIMSKALQVVYRVDILSGICVAFILVDGSVKFHYQGQCATQIPITNADYSSVISAGIGLIGSASQVVGSAVTGGASGGPIGAVLGAVGSAVSQAPSVASNVMGAKPDIRSGGSVGSSAGILSVQKPYLIIERPRQSLPEFQNTMTGYPSNITASVGDLAGYTEFETINLDNLFLTDAEKEELSNILKGGVYL